MPQRTPPAPLPADLEAVLDDLSQVENDVDAIRGRLPEEIESAQQVGELFVFAQEVISHAEVVANEGRRIIDSLPRAFWSHHDFDAQAAYPGWAKRRAAVLERRASEYRERVREVKDDG